MQLFRFFMVAAFVSFSLRPPRCLRSTCPAVRESGLDRAYLRSIFPARRGEYEVRADVPAPWSSRGFESHEGPFANRKAPRPACGAGKETPVPGSVFQRREVGEEGSRPGTILPYRHSSPGKE